MQNVPNFFYGTAWKEEDTARLTFEALHTGFRAIDTANQRKHYYEAGVGNGIKTFLAQGKCRREDLFLQTKFTYVGGQDHRLPYNDGDSLTQQVQDSFASSLQHLNTTYIDSYVLHGPYSYAGIQQEDLEAWAAMQDLVDAKKVKYLGISNVSAEQLKELCAQVRIKPAFVQNRCYARAAWDKHIRDICDKEKIKYQGFSILTANMREIMEGPALAISRQYKKSIAQVIFRFCQQLGMICLTGTTNHKHMREDLDINDFELAPDEVKKLEMFSCGP